MNWCVYNRKTDKVLFRSSDVEKCDKWIEDRIVNAKRDYTETAYNLDVLPDIDPPCAN